MKNYVLNHDFGYGGDNDKISKLTLRNLNDLNEYLKDLFKTQFLAWDIYYSLINIKVY